MANTTLSITYGSAGNRNKWTWSAWVKRSKLGSHQSLWSRYHDSNNIGDLRFQSDDGFTYQNYNNGSTNAQWNASQKFRDTNAWYHIVFVWDTGQATASDRIKVYLNGEDMAGSASTTPSQNTNSLINASASHKIGSRNSDQYFDGLMSHVHFCDGYAYSPTDFGETDSTTGQWKIKTNLSVSYGTNGFFLFKDDNSVNDQSGNGNNFTASGNLTQTEDNPSNVFCVMNVLGQLGGGTVQSGNTELIPTVDNNGIGGTIGVSSGKYYWETKWITYTGTGVNAAGAGIIDIDAAMESNLAKASNAGIHRETGNAFKGTTDLGNFITPANNDIIGVGFDADNGDLYFWQNGTAVNSGNAVITGLDTTKTWTPFHYAHTGGNSTKSQVNFGNGYFGTTAITSEGTNASGIGKFEYDVPTGYTALSTKGLNE